MPCQRAADVRQLLDTAVVLDGYGYTHTAEAVANAAEDIAAGVVDPAPKAET